MEQGVTFPPRWLLFSPGLFPTLAHAQTIPVHPSLRPAAATCPVLARPLAASSDLQRRRRRSWPAHHTPERLFLVQPRCCRCPHGPGWVTGEARSQLGGGGCGSIPGCPGATGVWQLRHRPYGFLRWMIHRRPRPGSAAPPAAARAPAEAGEGVMKSGFRHGAVPPAAAEVPSAAALALPERSVPPGPVEGLASVAQPGVASRGSSAGCPCGSPAALGRCPWASHPICRASAPPCPILGLHPPGSFLVASGLREGLGFLGVEGHQAPVQASAGASAPACSAIKPWSCARGWGFLHLGGDGRDTLSPQGRSCGRSVG